MPARLAVTGANGFLGRHVIRRALAEGIEARAIVRRPEAARQIVALGATATIVESFSSAALGKAFQDCSAVVHLAGIAREVDATFEQVNVLGTEAVVQAAQLVGLSRAVFVSGLGVAEAATRSWGQNRYFRSKKSAEDAIQRSRLPWVIFRPSYILGPGDELIPSLVKQLRAGVVYIAGEGTVPMQPIFVDDAASAFVRAASRRGRPNSVFDLVGPEAIGMKVLVDRVHSVLQGLTAAVPPPEYRFIPYSDVRRFFPELSAEEIDVMQSDALGDSGPLQRELGISLTPLSVAIEAAVRAELSRHPVGSGA